MDSYRKETPRKKVSSRRGTEKGSDKDGCPCSGRCGGCDLQGIPYAQQLQMKDRQMRKLLGGIVDTVHPVIGMENPGHYRCKVNAAFTHDRKGRPVSGKYAKNSHRVVAVDTCLIEDEKADSIVRDIRDLLPSFRIRTYSEDTGYGLLRHVQVRRGYSTGEYMVVLVCSSPVFPSKNNFVKALRARHPEIKTIILNVNDRHTSEVLGDRNITLYGPGFIEDELCGCRFRISPGSFYQVNPPQTEILYRTAIRYAGLTGREDVLDAYCGTGTIGIIMSGMARTVTGVELDRSAVKDAVWNAKRNGKRNVHFVTGDAGEYLQELAAQRKSSDGRAAVDINEVTHSAYPEVVVLDPPRSGTTRDFINAVSALLPKKVVYISCGPDTLARDLKLFRSRGYVAVEAQPVDLFPFTQHCETVVKLSRE